MTYLQTARLKLILVITLLAAIVFSQAHNAFADCSACFVLRGVRVQTKNGQKISGYVGWNEAWFKRDIYDIKFPDSLIDSKAWENTTPEFSEFVTLYTRVYSLSRLEKGLVTTKSGILKIRVSNVEKIIATPMRYDGYGCAGLPIQSMTEIRWLTNNRPKAVFTKNYFVSDRYIISYNRRAGKRELEEISKRLEMASSEEELRKIIRQLRGRRIVVLDIGYD